MLGSQLSNTWKNSWVLVPLSNTWIKSWKNSAPGANPYWDPSRSSASGLRGHADRPAAPRSSPLAWRERL
jgi:hypothetical protein